MAHTALGTSAGEILTSAQVEKLLATDGVGNMGFPGTGTAALPSLYPNGDTDTGLWSPAANTLAWSTAGVERMRIDSSGNVGIGMTPTILFETNPSTTGNGTLGFTAGSETTDSVKINAGGTVNTHLEYRAYLDHIFITNTTERMRIDSSGNVGIGTASPGGKTEIDQSSTSGAIPVLVLDQADIDDTFINFQGTSAADSTRSISSSTAEAAAKFGAVMIEINGVTKWIRVYDSAV